MGRLPIFFWFFLPKIPKQFFFLFRTRPFFNTVRSYFRDSGSKTDTVRSSFPRSGPGPWWGVTQGSQKGLPWFPLQPPSPTEGSRTLPYGKVPYSPHLQEYIVTPPLRGGPYPQKRKLNRSNTHVLIGGVFSQAGYFRDSVKQIQLCIEFFQNVVVDWFFQKVSRVLYTTKVRVFFFMWKICFPKIIPTIYIYIYIYIYVYTYIYVLSCQIGNCIQTGQCSQIGAVFLNRSVVKLG